MAGRGPDWWGAQTQKGGGPKGGGPEVGHPKFRAFLSLSGVFSWICGLGLRRWTTQIARVGFPGVILCKPRRPAGRAQTRNLGGPRHQTSTTRPQRVKKKSEFFGGQGEGGPTEGGPAPGRSVLDRKKARETPRINRHKHEGEQEETRSQNQT